ncbi:MAG: ATP-binding protein [Melioribacteraceae bacterium]|nr:ATP-binding protein [Melioribacteraceae bacterium]
MKVAIASGKGGTGKTTISTNLSAYLAEKRSVVLADLDVEEPNAKLFLDIELAKSEIKYKMIPEWNENCSLCGLCQEVCNFNAVIKLNTQIMVLPELCHSCYACSELCPENSLKMIPQKIGIMNIYKSDGLDFIESKMDIGQEQAVPLITKTKDYIKNNFDNKVLAIFDSPPGTSCPVIEVIKDCDLILLVTEPTPFGLHDLKLAIETAKQLHKPCAVIINRAEQGNLLINKFCAAENIDIIAEIPNDRQIATLYSGGQLLYNELPEVKKQLQNIEDYIDLFNYGGSYA